MLVAMALLAGVPGASAAGEGHPAPPAIDDARFEFLKGLEGAWISEGAGQERPPMEFEFRLTASGTALVEREMVGLPMEMLTVYAMEGPELMATHWCAIGNRPRAKAALVERDTLRFDCAGTPGNAASHDEEHVHGWTMRLGPDGRLHYAVVIAENGATKETHELVLTRRSDTARR